jgi:hypothetical protein
MLAVFLVGAVRELSAQATGTIYGAVYDASGAAVPGAHIVARHTATNAERSVVSNEQGQYVAPLLPVGEYTVTVEHAGFNTFEQTSVLLQANSTVQVNANLSIKGTSEQVLVTATQNLVQANTSSLVQVVDERRVTDLPLNGRNVMQLITLNAGIADSGAAGSTIQNSTIGAGMYNVSVSVNGSRGDGTNYILDNADNNDTYTNIALPFPNPDAVQEFSIQTSTFDAEYGRSVGGVVNVVTKSGANQLHGSLFEFFRNYDLNAANFFSGRDSLKRNQFGGSVGGPVYIPHLYDGRNRSFFFFSYQGTRISTATPGALATAPSDAMKRGDFSSWLTSDGRGAIHDPLNAGQYFPNNMIPITRFDPVSAKLLAYIPTSVGNAYNLRFQTPSNAIDDDQIVLRGDQSIGDKHRLSFRYFRLLYDQPWSFIPSNLVYLIVGQHSPDHNATFNYVYTISPRLVNQFSASHQGIWPTATPPAALDVNFASLGARILIASQPTMDVTISNWSGITLGTPTAGKHPSDTLQFSDHASYATGKHNLRFGMNFQRFTRSHFSYFRSGGTASFSGQLLSDAGKSTAGNAFAEFLLGRTASWIQSSVSNWSPNNNFWSLYVQDDYRVTPRLTLNLGLRWDPRTAYSEPDNKEMTFVPGQQSTRFPKAPLGLVFLGDAGVRNSIIPSDRNNFAPRIGFAFQAMQKTVVRGAYGVFFTEDPSIILNRGAQGQPFVRQVTFTGTPNPLSNIYGSQTPLDPNPFLPTSDFTFDPYGTWALPSKNLRTGYVQNWNMIMERQFFNDTVIRAGYVGSKGTSLMNTVEVNPGIYGPGATASNIDSRRPYQPIGGLQLALPAGFSTYHALQATFEKRFSHSYSLLANYTFSKSIDNTSYSASGGNNGGPDPLHFDLNHGLSDYDIPHRLVVSGIVEHPRLAKQNPVVRTLLGGWQSNFIFTAASGTPLTILSGVDNALTGVGGNWADLTNVDWRLPDGRSKQQEIQQWFNPAAFKQNAIGTVGTGRRNQLRGPGRWNVDYSLFKEFTLAEKTRLQARGEFFNFFNHANLSNPTTTVTSTNFGKITGAASPRIVQLALKLVF